MVLYGSPECWGYAELEQAWKYMTICCISFHPCRSIRKQIWPCHKNGQGQLRVIIWINLVVLEYPMLYTKFQGHWPLGSKEGDFWMSLPFMGVNAILVMYPEHLNKFSSQHPMDEWPWPLIFIKVHVLMNGHLGHVTRNKLSFIHPIEAPYEIWLWLAQWFLRRCLKSVDDVHLRPTYPISSPMSLVLGELKSLKKWGNLVTDYQKI